MRHEEENHWHPADRHPSENRRRPSRYQEEGNFNHFGNRWGEPDPRFAPHPDNRRQEEQHARRRNPEEDWAPFEQQLHEQRRRHEQHGTSNRHHGEPVWRQQDRHFDSSNQHANDRWESGSNMPHPNQEEQRYQENQRRRNRYRED